MPTEILVVARESDDLRNETLKTLILNRFSRIEIWQDFNEYSIGGLHTG